MLEITNLQVEVNESPILHGVDLTINPGEIHVIMGPNGSGKSTLSKVLAGREPYVVSQGSVQFLQQDLLALSPEKRAALGLFLGFQYPIEIPGVNNMYFMRTALNSIRKQRGESPIDAVDFMGLIKQKAKLVSMDEKYLHRSVNEGFSGGEKKRNEILQMLVLEPKLTILDEVDSGLDIDALQTVAQGVNSMRDAERSLLLVTHYQRLLDYIKPDFVHVLLDGRIIKSGDASLAVELEEKGYGWLQ